MPKVCVCEDEGQGVEIKMTYLPRLAAVDQYLPVSSSSSLYQELGNGP